MRGDGLAAPVRVAEAGEDRVGLAGRDHGLVGPARPQVQPGRAAPASSRWPSGRPGPGPRRGSGGRAARPPRGRPAGTSRRRAGPCAQAMPTPSPSSRNVATAASSRRSASSVRPLVKAIHARFWSAQASPLADPTCRNASSAARDRLVGRLELARGTSRPCPGGAAPRPRPRSSPRAAKASAASARVRDRQLGLPRLLGDVAQHQERRAPQGRLAQRLGVAPGLLGVGLRAGEVPRRRRAPRRGTAAARGGGIDGSGPTSASAWVASCSATASSSAPAGSVGRLGDPADRPLAEVVGHARGAAEVVGQLGGHAVVVRELVDRAVGPARPRGASRSTRRCRRGAWPGRPW